MTTDSNAPKYVVLGGGTGSFNVLSSLKNYTENITALVNMADDGGSTGRLRDEYGVLPPGDIRQCLVALSNSPHLRDLFNFRFPKETSLGGHSFGNLFLSAVEMQSGNFTEAIEIASEVLNIKGKVLPITFDKCDLIYTQNDGKKHKGEKYIDTIVFPKGGKPMLSYEKAVKLNPKAKQALLEADVVIIAPGSLYTSLVPLFLVEEMPPLMKNIKAKVVYVANLVNKPADTKDFSVSDYVQELERFMGKNTIDYVLYNTDKPNENTLKLYAKDNEFPVTINRQELDRASFKAIPGKFLSKKMANLTPDDPLFAERSLIRHDGDALSRAILKISVSNKTKKH